MKIKKLHSGHTFVSYFKTFQSTQKLRYPCFAFQTLFFKPFLSTLFLKKIRREYHTMETTWFFRLYVNIKKWDNIKEIATIV
jgi:hypothetical protein